ncbi:MAG: hypothetical protein IJT40_03165 [Firmicutes bacterium]|nr:hypothetical protein [Bacillota bacterium]
MGSTIQGLLITLGLTLVYYMGPLLIYRFAIVKHKLSRAKVRKAGIISGVVMYALMLVIYLIVGLEGVPNMAAALIWTAVACFIIRDDDPKTGNKEVVEVGDEPDSHGEDNN